ncbi:unnamed protein product [Ectocarpus sp. 12 AP-2014]
MCLCPAKLVLLTMVAKTTIVCSIRKAKMASIGTVVIDATTDVLCGVLVCTGLCAIIAAFQSFLRPNSRKFNKCVVPAFPCEGTLILLAKDGVMYVIPRGKAVVKTDMVRDVHSGRIARRCDHHGLYTYFETKVGQDQQHGEYAADQLRSDWSIGSVRSQDMTVSTSDDESLGASPPQSPTASEMLTNRVEMI